MSNSNSSKQVLLSVIGVAILVVAVVGVSFAFFNYTRTGGANTVSTGTIQFNSTQSHIALSNAFPIAGETAHAATADSHANVAVSTVTITGTTTYAYGLDFTVTAKEVDLNGLPISVYVEHPTTGGAQLSNVASSAAAASGNSIYVHSYENVATVENRLKTNDLLAEGHINANTQANETIIIRAFLDDDKVFITDTPNGGQYDPAQTPEAGYATGNPNASNGTVVPEGKTAITTTQWNALNASGTAASFKIEVSAHESAAPAATPNAG